MTRTYSPIRVPDVLTDDKDRHIRKLKTILAPLKQQLQVLPILEQKFLHIKDRSTALQRQNSVMKGEFHLRQESATRAQIELKSDIQILKCQQREFALQLNDLVIDNGALDSQLEKINLQLGDHKDLTDILIEKGEQLGLESSKLKSVNKGLAEDNIRLMHKSKSLAIENDELCLKTSQLRGLSNEMNTHKKIYIQRLQQFQNDNNSLDAKVCDKQEIHQSTIVTLKKQDSALALEQQAAIELETRADKLASDLNHIASNLRLQSQISADLNTQIRNAERALDDYKIRLSKSSQDRKDGNSENEGVMGVNFQLKKDWDSCEQHLENLVEQNQLLNRELSKFIQQDDFIMKLIMQRRARPTLSSYVLKSSRVTGI